PPERAGVSSRAPHGVPVAGDDRRARADILALAGSRLAVSEPLGRPGCALGVVREREHWRCPLATRRVEEKRLRMKTCVDLPGYLEIRLGGIWTRNTRRKAASDAGWFKAC